MAPEMLTQFSLTDAIVEQFQCDGVVSLPGVFEAATVEWLRTAVERVIAAPGPYFANFDKSGKGAFFAEHFVWRHSADFRALCLQSPLPAFAARLMGSKRVNLAWDALFVKEPGTPAESFWHQDQPYAWMDGRQNASFWIALDHVTADSGAVQFVKGSHRWGRLFEPKSFHPGRQYASGEFEPMPDIEAGRGTIYDIVQFESAPGDMIAFDFSVVHYAPGNSSKRRRRAIGVKYCGDDAHFVLPKNGPKLPDDHGLKVGDPIGGPVFPQAWPTATRI